MEQKTVFLLMEPNFITPVWFSRSIDGLKTAAARQRRQVRQVAALEEIDEESSAVVIVSTASEWTRKMIDGARRRSIRPVLIGSIPAKYGEDVSGTMYSSKSSIEEMVRYYNDCRRGRIALVGINSAASNDMTKCDTFLTTARELGMDCSINDVYYKSPAFQNPIESFLAAIERYDGVICSNDYIAVFILNYAKEHGIRVPEQLYVAGLGDILLCRYTDPSLTSATRSYYEAGEQAFDIWRQLNQNPNVLSIVTAMRCEIKTRGSTANKPAPLYEARRAAAAAAEALKPVTQEGSNAVRALENCLSQCDKLDMGIISGLMNNVNVENLAEQLFVAPGTIHYRLKKLYKAADVSSKAEFLRLFNRYIHGGAIFVDFAKGNFDPQNLK